MYILEIKQPEKAWIAAIGRAEQQIEEYIGTLPADIRAHVVCHSISLENFPLVVVEYHKGVHDSDARFEYCTMEKLQELMDTFRSEKVADEDHVYFRYYFFDDEYFQDVPNKNYMRFRQHTTVTNSILDEPYPISVFHEEIKKQVANYHIEGLDELFEQTRTLYTTPLEKEDLAVNGYESLFWEMNYDHACGKLTDEGIAYLLPMVDKMETLLGEKKWQHRSYALHIVLEKACEERSGVVSSLFQETVAAFEHYRETHPAETPDIHRLLALVYQWMMEADTASALLYWQQARAEMRKAIDYAPEKASWSSVLELIYLPLGEDEKIKAAQAEAQERFMPEALVLESIAGPVLAYRIAQAYQHLRECWVWKKIDIAFPEKEALFWTERSLAYQPQDIFRIEMHECAQFYHRIGSRKKKIDFLKKAMSLYERIMAAVISDSGQEIYYIVNLWKEIAGIYLGEGDIQSADNAMVQAQQLYKQYDEAIRSHRSSFLHYAEFLEYCFFTYPGNIEKPLLAELKRIAGEVEIQSEGFLSYPYRLLMKISLYEHNESQAIIELTKSLILHELCADAEYKTLWEEYKDSGFERLKGFLHETTLFVSEVSQNYYYHPELKWEQLREMGDEELTAYWENRKKEIRNRPVHHIE